jgi:hypothetical protein
MPPENIARLILELGRGDGPISGRLLEDTRETRFVGWLALAAALESARSGSGPLERGPGAHAAAKE